MNESLLNLDRFIQDFCLRKPNGAIYFNATIIFCIDGNRKAEHSEVHIITSDNLGTLYFLNPQIIIYGLPDYFEARNYHFIYNSGECLKLEHNNYVIAIFPQTA